MPTEPFLSIATFPIPNTQQQQAAMTSMKVGDRVRMEVIQQRKEKRRVLETDF